MIRRCDLAFHGSPEKCKVWKPIRQSPATVRPKSREMGEWGRLGAMDRRWIARLVVVGVVLTLALVIRSYFSPANVVKRSLRAAIESFEEEQMLGAMHPVSRRYSDRWGMGYEAIAAHLRGIMESFDALAVDLDPPDVTVEGDEVIDIGEVAEAPPALAGREPSIDPAEGQAVSEG